MRAPVPVCQDPIAPVAPLQRRKIDRRKIARVTCQGVVLGLRPVERAQPFAILQEVQPPVWRREAITAARAWC